MKYRALFLFIILVFAGFVSAQEEVDVTQAVQVITGEITSFSGDIYDLPDLVAGDTVYITLIAPEDGFFDPILAFGEPLTLGEHQNIIDTIALFGYYSNQWYDILNSNFLDWNDDRDSENEDYNSELIFEILEDGDYQILVNDCCGEMGPYELTIGINIPEVLDGDAEATGDIIAIFNEEITFGISLSGADDVIEVVDEGFRAEQVIGGLLSTRGGDIYDLPDLHEGDILYVFMENLSEVDPFLAIGDETLSPDIFIEALDAIPEDCFYPCDESDAIFDEAFTLWNDDRDLENENYDSVLIFEIPEDGNYRLLTGDCCNSAGEYQIFIGINVSEVIDGMIFPTDEPIAILNEAVSFSNVEVGQVEQIEDSVTPYGYNIYDIRGVQAGDIIYVHVKTRGQTNVGISITPAQLGNGFPASGWASPTGIAEFEVPDSGDFRVIISGDAFESSGRIANYELTVGINELGVLTNDAESNTSGLIIVDRDTPIFTHGENREFVIPAFEQLIVHSLQPLKEEDILYIYLSGAENTTFYADILDGDGNFITSAESFGSETEAITNIRIPYDIDDPVIVIASYTLDETGDKGYSIERNLTMSIGINDPDILLGEPSRISGSSMFLPPNEIEVNLEILQFTDVDQQSENFGIVARLTGQWWDEQLIAQSALARELAGIYTGEQFTAFVRENSDRFRIPEFIISNQQGEKVIQFQRLQITNRGYIVYQERFSTTAQAPLFDFRNFPYDHQDFFVQVELSLPLQQYGMYVSEELPSDISASNGEEEWQFELNDVYVGRTGNYAQFNFEFGADRHLTFYIFRIFTPLLIIVAIGWAIFFIDDYETRIAASSGNMLLFIAFNFTIGDDLPRLGYLTFMDALLLICFLITASVFAFDVYLWRLSSGNEGDAKNADHILVIAYPLLFIVAIFVLVMWFGISF